MTEHQTAPIADFRVTQGEVILPVDKLHGLAIVVDDLDKAMSDFGNFFCIESWQVHRLRTGDNFVAERGGKAVEAEMLLAVGQINDTYFELWQPLSGNNLLADFAARRKNGAHDLSTNVIGPAEIEGVLTKLRREGIGVLQKFSIGDVVDLYYLDTQSDLATVIKLIVPHHGMMDSLVDLPGGETRSLGLNANLPRFPCDKNYHSCVTVEHGRRLGVKEAYERLLGLDKWFELDSECNVTATECYHYGEPGNWRFKTASGRREAFGIEIVEPYYGKCGYTDMLEQNGEGLHHIMTAFCSLEAVNDAQNTLAASHYRKAQEGLTGPIYYCYLQSETALAGLGVEAICPVGEGWEAMLDSELNYLLFGPDRADYRHTEMARAISIA